MTAVKNKPKQSYNCSQQQIQKANILFCVGLLLWGYTLLEYVTQPQNLLITKSRIKTMVESAIHQPKLPADRHWNRNKKSFISRNCACSQRTQRKENPDSGNITAHLQALWGFSQTPNHPLRTPVAAIRGPQHIHPIWCPKWSLLLLL